MATGFLTAALSTPESHLHLPPHHHHHHTTTLEDSDNVLAGQMFCGGDPDFVGLDLDFDMDSADMQLDNVDFPLDLWAAVPPSMEDDPAADDAGQVVGGCGGVEPISADGFGLEPKLDPGEEFNLAEDFHQMLDDWDSQLGALQNSDTTGLDSSVAGVLVNPIAVQDIKREMNELLQLEQEAEGQDLEEEEEEVLAMQQSVATTFQSSPAPSATTTISVKRPGLGLSSSSITLNSSAYRSGQTVGNSTGGGYSRQLSAGTVLRTAAPVVSRGVCYTRTGGLGVTRSVQSNGFLTSPNRSVLPATRPLSFSSSSGHGQSMLATAVQCSGIGGGSSQPGRLSTVGGGGGLMSPGASSDCSSSCGGRSDDYPFLYTPVSPRAAPSSSNAPDFFVASTRSTADVKSSYSSYCKILESPSHSRSYDSDCIPLVESSGNSSGPRTTTHHRHSNSSSSCNSSPLHSPTTTNNNNNSHVKIIAALSPKRDGSATTRILSSRSIRDSLPKELIDKIKAASQGRKTIAIIEPIGKRDSSSTSMLDSMAMSPNSRQRQHHQQQQQHSHHNHHHHQSSKFSVAAANLTKWRNIGVVPPLSNSNNNMSDHDYCCPNRPGRYRNRYTAGGNTGSSSSSVAAAAVHNKMLRQIEESLSRNAAAANSSTTLLVNSSSSSSIATEEPVSAGGRVARGEIENSEAKKDSGLESCEMSDCSEDSGGGLYDRLPRYLTTSVSVQTGDNSVMEEHGYNRLPSYLVKPQQSLLKSNNLTGGGRSSSAEQQARSTLVVAPLDYGIRPAQQQQQAGQVATNTTTTTSPSVVPSSPPPTAHIEVSRTSIRVDENNSIVNSESVSSRNSNVDKTDGYFSRPGAAGAAADVAFSSAALTKSDQAAPAPLGTNTISLGNKVGFVKGLQVVNGGNIGGGGNDAGVSGHHKTVIVRRLSPTRTGKAAVVLGLPPLKRRRRAGGSDSSSEDESDYPSYGRKRRFCRREYKSGGGGHRSPHTSSRRRSASRGERKQQRRHRRRSSSCSSSPSNRRRSKCSRNRRDSPSRSGSRHRPESRSSRPESRSGGRPGSSCDHRPSSAGRGDRPTSAAAGVAYDQERSRQQQERRRERQEKQRQVEERRVIYVGGIAEGTLKADLRRRFELFGPIVDISVHFREHGDNYGFITFQFKVDAFAAIEHGNDDPAMPSYELSFGGRRAFCKEKYYDLDDVDEESGEEGGLGFDELLRRARGEKKP